MYKTSMVALASKSPYVNIKFAMIFYKCRNLIFCISDFVCSNFSIMHLSLKSWNEDDKDISRWSSAQKQLAFFTNRIKMFVHSQKCWILKKYWKSFECLCIWSSCKNFLQILHLQKRMAEIHQSKESSNTWGFFYILQRVVLDG